MIGSTCEYCDGRIVETRSTERFTVRGTVLVIDDCPIGICPKCGEKYYPARLLRKVESYAQGIRQGKRANLVPFFKYSGHRPARRLAST
jgi:YgiT-type zinc finger domain-containing protein